MHHIGCGDMVRPFMNNWIYVEFFLILSGFFTAKHFDRAGNENVSVTRAVFYTVNKYKRFLPYMFAAVLLEYMVRYGHLVLKHDWTGFFTAMEDFPAEVFFLSAANTNGTRLSAVWYLSATFLVYPLISLIAQLKNKERSNDRQV